MSTRLAIIVAKIGLLLASTLLSVAALELGLTFWYADLRETGPFELVEEWGSPFIFKARSHPESKTYGVRRSLPIELATPPGTTRILSYGDSISAGHKLSEPETYAYMLEKRLSESNDGIVEVLNMSRGHSPTIHSFHLRSDVPRFKPDGVVLEIELINDVSDEARVHTSGEDEDGLPLQIHRHRYLLGWDGHILSPLSVFGSSIERTKLYAKLSRWYGRLRYKMNPNPIFEPDSNKAFYHLYPDRFLLTQPALDDGFERIFRTVSGIHRYLERQGIRFLLVIIPSRHVFTREQYTETSTAIVARAERRAEELEIPYVSMTAALAERGGAELFMDFCHPTGDGNEVIADVLEPVLVGW